MNIAVTIHGERVSVWSSAEGYYVMVSIGDAEFTFVLGFVDAKTLADLLQTAAKAAEARFDEVRASK